LENHLNYGHPCPTLVVTYLGSALIFFKGGVLVSVDTVWL